MGRRRRKGEWNWALSLNQASSYRCVIEALIRSPIAIVVEAAFSSQLIEMLDGSFAEPFHVFFATKRGEITKSRPENEQDWLHWQHFLSDMPAMQPGLSSLRFLMQYNRGYHSNNPEAKSTCLTEKERKKREERKKFDQGKKFLRRFRQFARSLPLSDHKTAVKSDAQFIGRLTLS